MHVAGVKKMTIEGGKWQFFHNDANNQELIKFVASCVTQERKYHLKLPLIIKFAYINNEMEELFIGNQDEAEKRLILLSLLAKNDVVIVAEDNAMTVKYNWALNFEKG